MSKSIGLSFVVISIVLLFLATLEKKIRLASLIQKDKGLRRLAEEATRNHYVQRELDHLIEELGKGHFGGLPGVRHIAGTDIFYLRGRQGGRLYYRKTNEGYEIVGKSAKGRNQEQVIQKLVELYSR